MLSMLYIAKGILTLIFVADAKKHNINMIINAGLNIATCIYPFVAAIMLWTKASQRYRMLVVLVFLSHSIAGFFIFLSFVESSHIVVLFLGVMVNSLNFLYHGYLALLFLKGKDFWKQEAEPQRTKRPKGPTRKGKAMVVFSKVLP